MGFGKWEEWGEGRNRLGVLFVSPLQTFLFAVKVSRVWGAFYMILDWALVPSQHHMVSGFAFPSLFYNNSWSSFRPRIRSIGAAGGRQI